MGGNEEAAKTHAGADRRMRADARRNIDAVLEAAKAAEDAGEDVDEAIMAASRG